MIRLKSKKDIAGIKDSGHILAETFDQLKKLIASGITTKEIDSAAEKFITEKR